MTNPPYAGHRPHTGGRRVGNPGGLISVILVAAALALQVVSAVVSAAVLGSAATRFDLYGLFTTVFAVLQGIVAVAAIALGAMGLAARDRPKALAGIGLGGGTVVLFGLLAGQLTTLLLFASRG